ncbi:MAG TPA: winged helix-turn-helix domain-containing protein [Acetobacteraceae bacterium]
MPSTGQQAFQFGPFRLDGHRRSLTRDGVAVPLGGRALDILLELAMAAGETVSKSALLDRVWPGLIVEENNLQVHISALRKALGEGWIITVPGRGYRLAAARPLSDGPPLPERPSIAVLAFTNMSGDPDQEYFSDGIADDIITELSRIRWLFVIARNSSFAYKGRAVDLRQIGRELGVRYILEGSVRRSGGRVRVTAQLIEAETASHIWAERYDRGITEVFTVQDQITTAVTAAILPVVADAEQRRAMRKLPESLGAWEAYQRGLWHLARPTAENFRQARNFFERAIEVDPMFAPPYYRLAHLTIGEGAVYQSRTVPEIVSIAEPLARRAIEIDPDDADAQAVASAVSAWRGDWDAALARAEQAVRMSPNSVSAHRALGFCLLNFERYTDARNEFLACLRISSRDPLNWLIRLQLGTSYYYECDYETASDTLWQASRASPDEPEVYFCLAAALGQLGRTAEAQAALRHATNIVPGRAPTIVPRRRSEDLEHLLDGLRKAGWRG